MLVGEVGVVEQAGEEERGAAADAEALLEHQAQDLARVPHVDEVHRLVAQQRHEERVEHPDEVADRRAGDRRRAARREHVVELAGLEADRAVRVDDALRVAGGARGEADERRRVGVDGDGRGERARRRAASANGGGRGAGARRPGCRRRPATAAPGRSASSVVVHREVVGVAEAVGGDDARRAAWPARM